MVASSPPLIERIRSNRFIWGIRFLQGVFALAVLGICASNASSWHNISCSTPSRLAYHIFAGTVTLVPVAFFILTTGPLSYTNLWTFWIQTSLDGLFLIFWIAAAAVSNYTCDGLCSSCNGAFQEDGINYPFTVTVGSLLCRCNYGSLAEGLGEGALKVRGFDGSTKTTPTGGGGDLEGVGEKAVDIAAKQGLDGSMIFLLFVTLLTGIYLYYRRSDPTPDVESDAAKDAEEQTDNIQAGIGLNTIA